MKRLSQSLFLCPPLCCTSPPSHVPHTLSIFLSLYPPPLRYISFSPRGSLSISCLFTLASFASNVFLFLSAVINHGEREILHWKRGRARDIYPVLAGARWKGLQILDLLGCKHIYQGMNYLPVVYTCLQKHVCLDARCHLWRAEQQQTAPLTWRDCLNLQSAFTTI